MSQYLVERIHATENIEVRLQAEIVAGRGDGHLQAITIADRMAGTKEEVRTNWVFVFIGASPHTDWLGSDVARDEKGFIITGQDLLTRKDGPRWPLSRAPFVLETSVPGVFAAGDVRLDSMKRVASAVGEGAMAVYLVHRQGSGRADSGHGPTRPATSLPAAASARGGSFASRPGHWGNWCAPGAHSPFT